MSFPCALCLSAFPTRVEIAWIVLALSVLLMAPPLAAQPSSAQPVMTIPNLIQADSATQDTESGEAEVRRDSLPREPGFHDLADRFDIVTEFRLRSALSRLPQTTTAAPRISVVILGELAGEVQDQTQRIFQSCCTGPVPSRTKPQADSTAVADHGNVLLVVYPDANTIGIAADARGYETLPRDTLKRIASQSMMIDGRYVQSRRSVHAGLTAIFAELGADEETMQRVSVNGPPRPRDEVVRDVLLILALFFVVLFIPGVVVTGVVTVMESSGCLRHVLYFLSWALITAWTVGTFIGLHELLGEPFGGNAEVYLIVPGGVISLVVYSIINGVMNRWLDDLSEDDYETWKHTLRGGAAVGASAGAVGNLVRSAVAKGSSGFGGFGGGGFGGGGAGGSFQAASGAVGSASASGAAASASGAASTVAGSGGAVGTASVSGGAVGSAGVLSGLSAKYRWRALRRRIRAFRWYHYITFAVVAYVFYQIAIYALWALQFEPLFWMVAVPTTIYAALRLWDRWGPDIQERVRNRFNDDEDEDEDDPDFPGDYAMASW